MSIPADWAQEYARQADADFKTWYVLQENDAAAECHRLLFLQMACEKLCKSHLIQGGTPPEALQTSHGFIANPLPVIIRQQIIYMRQHLKGMAGVLHHTGHIAREIELLNPAVDRDGKRPDNCEYPWEDDTGVVRSPLDWTFSPSRLLTTPSGRTFLKLVREAINRLL
jgi:hypothetical protein